MIKANELTVGRCFIFTNENSVARDIDKEDMADIDELLCVIEPIPLTPEVLEKCGFDFIPEWDYPDRSKGDAWILKPYIVSETDNNIYGISWLIGGIFSSCPTEVKHLHQLQNLYFALTGEELNIQL